MLWHSAWVDADPEGPPSGIVTFLFTDIEGSTRRWEVDANAMGAAELAQNSVQGRMLEVQQASVQMAGHSRLEQIRASMRGEALPSGASGTATSPAPASPASIPEATPEKPIGQ